MLMFTLFIVLVIDGWDISPLNLAESMVRAKVIDYDLQQQLKKEMSAMKPRPAIYDPDFIAANQVCHVIFHYHMF